MMWLLEIINITYHMKFIIFKNSKCYLQKHFETFAIILNITTHCPNIHENPKYLLIIRVHEGWNPMATCVIAINLVGSNMGWTQPSPKGPAHMSKPDPKNSNRRLRIENKQPTLFIFDQGPVGGLYKRTKSLRMN